MIAINKSILHFHDRLSRKNRMQVMNYVFNTSLNVSRQSIVQI